MINKKLLKSHKFVCPTDHTIVLPIILFSSYSPTLYSLLKYNEAFCALFVLPQSPQGCKISICSTSSQRIKLSRKFTKKKTQKNFTKIHFHCSSLIVIPCSNLVINNCLLHCRNLFNEITSVWETKEKKFFQENFFIDI